MAYKTNQAIMEPSDEEVYIGSYGLEWLKFMKAYHPELVEQMTTNNTLMVVAQLVDNEAWEYRELLDVQYAKQHPRPT